MAAERDAQCSSVDISRIAGRSQDRPAFLQCFDRPPRRVRDIWGKNMIDTSKVFCCKFTSTHNPGWDGFIAIGYVQLAHYTGIGPSGTKTIRKARRPELIGRTVTPELIAELQAECDAHPRLQYLSSMARPAIGRSPHFVLSQDEALELDAIEASLGALAGSMQVFKNSIWSFDDDKPISAEHDGSVAVLDNDPPSAEILRLLELHDRVVTPTTVHDDGGAYDRKSGESLYTVSR